MKHLTLRVRDSGLVLSVNQTQQVVSSYKTTTLSKKPMEFLGINNAQGRCLLVRSLHQNTQKYAKKKHHNRQKTMLRSRQCIVMTKAIGEKQLGCLGFEVGSIFGDILMDTTLWCMSPICGRKTPSAYKSAAFNAEGKVL